MPLRLARRLFDIRHERGATSNTRQAAFAGKKTSISTFINKKNGKVDSQYYIDETKYEPENSLSECMISPYIINHSIRNFLVHICLCFVNVKWLTSMSASSVSQYSFFQWKRSSYLKASWKSNRQKHGTPLQIRHSLF